MTTQGQPIRFTKQTFLEMKARRRELYRLQEEVLVRLKMAREMGDLSENGAYKYAKFELGNTRRELGKLNRLIANGVIEESKEHYDQVEFGCTFTIQQADKQLTFMLVSKHESNPSECKISDDSPIGAAALGKKVGEKFVVKSPKGEVEYEVVEIGVG